MIEIDMAKATDEPQFTVVSYMNKAYLEELLHSNGVEVEVFDMPDIAANSDRFPSGAYPFWHLFYRDNPDVGNEEEVLSVISAKLDATYLRELLTSKEVHADYYAWWQAHPDEPYDNYHAWNEFDDRGFRVRHVSAEDAADWCESEESMASEHSDYDCLDALCESLNQAKQQD